MRRSEEAFFEAEVLDEKFKSLVVQDGYKRIKLGKFGLEIDHVELSDGDVVEIIYYRGYSGSLKNPEFFLETEKYFVAFDFDNRWVLWGDSLGFDSINPKYREVFAKKTGKTYHPFSKRNRNREFNADNY